MEPAIAESVARVARIADIRDVSLAEIHCSLLAAIPPHDEPGGQFSAVLNLQTVHADVLQDGMKVSASFRFEGRSGDSAETAFVRIEATFHADYGLDKEQAASVSPDDLQAFAKHNAVFNIWPFWRELLRDMTGRMSLPFFTAPLLKSVLLPVKGRSKRGKPKAASAGNAGTRV